MGTIIRRAVAAGIALLLFLVLAVPAAAYNEENVASITMTRLDAVSCTSDIRIQVTLRDEAGNPVQGPRILFRFLEKERGDRLSPARAQADAAGQATVFVDLSCRRGVRFVQARIPRDGAAQLHLICRAAQGCTLPGTPEGGVGGIEEQNPPSGDIPLPETNPLSVVPGLPPAASPPVIGYLLGGIMLAGVLVSLFYGRRPNGREASSLAPE
jgi:hypothetical protein